jgi:hypothetical protein
MAKWKGTERQTTFYKWATRTPLISSGELRCSGWVLQFLLRWWRLSCCSYYKTDNKPWMRKEPCYDYDKRNISVIIFDTDIKKCLRNWYKTCSELRLRTSLKQLAISHMFITANKKAFNHKIILHRLIFADKK